MIMFERHHQSLHAYTRHFTTTVGEVGESQLLMIPFIDGLCKIQGTKVTKFGVGWKV